MSRMKCCPKCGSTNINFLVFYRPSIWKCSDCGYEGAFIIEGGDKLVEKLQEYCRKRYNIADWMEGETRMYDWGGSTGNQQKTLEEHVTSVANPEDTPWH